MRNLFAVVLSISTYRFPLHYFGVMGFDLFVLYEIEKFDIIIVVPIYLDFEVTFYDERKTGHVFSVFLFCFGW